MDGEYTIIANDKVEFHLTENSMKIGSMEIAWCNNDISFTFPYYLWLTAIFKNYPVTTA